MKYKYLWTLGIFIILSGCVATPSINNGWTVRNSYDPASGHSGCTLIKSGILIVGVNVASNLKSGKLVSISAIESYGIYPGSTVYVKIGNERWSGKERVKVSQELYHALMSGSVMDISWSPWPDGTRKSRQIDLAGFSSASQCIAELI